MRRSLILAVCFAAILPVAAWGQTPLATDQLKPYLQVKPVAGDERMVRAFFSPSCNYSQMYFQFFKNLQATLPDGKTFAFTPVVNKGDGISYALSFLAVQKFYPAYLNNFIEASLVGVQDKGLSIYQVKPRSIQVVLWRTRGFSFVGAKKAAQKAIDAQFLGEAKKGREGVFDW